MNKSMKPSAAAPRPLTEEEKKSQIMRAFMQKKASLAEGVLFNLIQACGSDLCYDLENNQTKDNPTKIVKMANDMADEFMRVVYGQEITYKETSEK